MPIYKIKGKQKDGLQAYNVTINYTDDAGKKRQIKRTVYGLTAANLPIIRIHDFRHSHASLLINNNINILEVAHRLGHASTTQTLQVYAHLFPNDKNKVVKLLDSL